MSRDRHINQIQESPFQKGKELELSLLGHSSANPYEPQHVIHARRLNEAIQLVKSDVDAKEQQAENAPFDSPRFRYSEITTNPTSIFASALYEKLAAIIGYEDFDSKKIRFYNCIDTIMDRHFGTDFFLEIDPTILPEEKFGPDIKRLTKPLIVTGDITMNPEKAAHKADVILQYERLPETKQEAQSWGEEASWRMIRALTDVIGKTLGISYDAPILKAREEKMKREKKEQKNSAHTIKKISSTVIKRTRQVTSQRDENRA